MSVAVQVVVKLDAAPRAAENPTILLISTEGVKDYATYYSLDEIQKAYPNKKVTKMAEALFNQGKTTLADSLVRKVDIVGFDSGTKDVDLIDAIDELRQTHDDWYIFLSDAQDADTVALLAEYAQDSEPTEAEIGTGIEDHRKFYFGEILVADVEKFKNKYKRSAILCVGSDASLLEEYPAAAWVGNVIPFYPESVTWMFKAPQGITLPMIPKAQRDKLEEYSINFFTSEYKREFMKNGVCNSSGKANGETAPGDFIDVVLGADYIVNYMRNALYDVFMSNPKIPYTDAGFTQVTSAVLKALNRAVDLGIIARQAESGEGMYNVVQPRERDATEDQHRERRMPDIIWEAQLEGAVHMAKVTGSLAAYLPNITGVTS